MGIGDCAAVHLRRRPRAAGTSKQVTTPKLPPPPRSAQNRSGFSVCAGAQPAAVGRDQLCGEQVVAGQAEARGRCVPRRRRGSGRRRRCRRPCRRWYASPKACGLAVELSEQRPGLHACALRATGSTSTARIGETSIMSPPSQADWPERLWPPPRTAVSSACALAKLTACITSAAPAQRTISAGLRSKAGFHRRRARRSPCHRAPSSSPRSPARSSSTSLLLTVCGRPSRPTIATSLALCACARARVTDPQARRWPRRRTLFFSL